MRTTSEGIAINHQDGRWELSIEKYRTVLDMWSVKQRVSACVLYLCLSLYGCGLALGKSIFYSFLSFHGKSLPVVVTIAEIDPLYLTRTRPCQEGIRLTPLFFRNDSRYSGREYRVAARELQVPCSDWRANLQRFVLEDTIWQGTFLVFTIKQSTLPAFDNQHQFFPTKIKFHICRVLFT